MGVLCMCVGGVVQSNDGATDVSMEVIPVNQQMCMRITPRHGQATTSLYHCGVFPLSLRSGVSTVVSTVQPPPVWFVQKQSDALAHPMGRAPTLLDEQLHYVSRQLFSLSTPSKRHCGVGEGGSTRVCRTSTHDKPKPSLQQEHQSLLQLFLLRCSRIEPCMYQQYKPTNGGAASNIFMSVTTEQYVRATSATAPISITQREVYPSGGTSGRSLFYSPLINVISQLETLHSTVPVQKDDTDIDELFILQHDLAMYLRMATWPVCENRDIRCEQLSRVLIATAFPMQFCVCMHMHLPYTPSNSDISGKVQQLISCCEGTKPLTMSYVSELLLEITTGAALSTNLTFTPQLT